MKKNFLLTTSLSKVTCLPSDPISELLERRTQAANTPVHGTALYIGFQSTPDTRACRLLERACRTHMYTGFRSTRDTRLVSD